MAAASATLLTVAGLIATGRVREDSFVRGFSAAALLACALTTVAAVCVRSLGRARFRAVSKRWEKPATRHEEVAAEKARANVLALAPRMIGAALRRLYPLRAEHESSSARFVSDAEWIQPVVFMSEGRRKPIPQLWSKDGSAAAAKKETTAKKARTTTAKRATASKAKETTVKRAPAKRGLAKSALAKSTRAKETFAREKTKVKRTGRTKTSVATRSAPERKRASARNARKHGMMTSVLGFLRFGRGR